MIRVRPAIGVFREEVRRLLERRRARLAAGETLPRDLVTLLMQMDDTGVAEVDIYTDSGFQPDTLVGALTSPATYPSTLDDTPDLLH